MSQDRTINTSYPPPLIRGDDPLGLVDIVIDDQGILYTARRNAQIIQRFSPQGDPLPPIEVYAPIRGLVLWTNPRLVQAAENS